MTTIQISKFNEFIPQLLQKHKIDIQSQNKIQDNEVETEFKIFPLVNHFSLNKSIFPYANYEKRAQKLQSVMTEMNQKITR